MKASGSINVFTGILVFILIWLVVSQVLEMKLLGSIFDKLVSVGVLALIVLFQDEIRRFLLTLGSHQHASALVRFFTGNKKEGMEHDEIMPVVMACISMGKQKVGALIVVEHNMPLDDVVRTGGDYQRRYKPAPDRKYLFQEQSVARRSYGYQQETH